MTRRRRAGITRRRCAGITRRRRANLTPTGRGAVNPCVLDAGPRRMGRVSASWAPGTIRRAMGGGADG